jgi:hypothetical protein
LGARDNSLVAEIGKRHLFYGDRWCFGTAGHCKIAGVGDSIPLTRRVARICEAGVSVA